MKNAIGILTVLLAASAANALVVFDDFTDPPTSQAVAIPLLHPNPTLGETTGATILGGERDLLITVDGTANMDSFIGTIGDGLLSFNSNAPGTILTLQYDGLDPDIYGPPATLVNSEGLGGLDLLAMGDYLYLDFERIDGGIAQVTGITINVNGTGGTAVFSDVIPDSAGPMTFVALFSAFSNPSVLSDVTSIEFILNPDGATDVDFALSAVGVPEPATLVLLGMGSLTLLRRRRRAA